MVIVGGNPLRTKDFEEVLFKGSTVSLDGQALTNISSNFNFLQSYSKDKVIYGINTGLGPMAQYKISDEDQRELQYNLIRSHSTGMGTPFGEDFSRATMLARLNSLMKGASGIHPQTVELLVKMLNQGVSALIFSHGGVGASGDLVQLAHLALNLIGEGEVLYKGKLESANKIFSLEKIEPLKIHLREGLAIMNGTSAMTGIGMVNVIQAKKIIQLSVQFSAITNELMKSFDDHFSLELNQVKLHPGQQKIAEGMRYLLKDSKMIRKRPDHLYHRKIEEAVFTDKVQEYYSLRCVPQILGPVLDTVLRVEEVLENEVNSSNDNPVIDHNREMVYHGGNFHGDYVALEMDKLKMVMTKLTMLAERQLNYLLNDKLNQKLSPFINLGKLGLNFGMQGLQFTATSTTAENQTLSYPMYLHSISNNNDNQDIVSMGCNAAILTAKVIENAFEILSIQLIGLLQAIDHLKCQSRLASSTLQLYHEVREFFPVILEDQPQYKNMEAVKIFLKQYSPKVEG